MDVRTGRALGSRYQLLERIGGGAMGEVWRTLDRVTSTDVAAKLLRGEYARDQQIVARFIQERGILLALQHPNIVEVRDLVVEGDDLAIVMQLVRGSDLRTRLREQGTLAPAEAVRVTVDVLRALAHAHEHSCLHRDVKPDNVLLEDGRVLLTDFGIARLTQETTARATGALGTPEYMAPEIFSMEQVSAAADVYGAGIQLYELLAGRTPFAGGSNPYAVANRHVTAAPPPLPGLPERLAEVLATMLAKEPRRRLSAEAAAQALTELLPELDGLAALSPQPQPADWASAGAARLDPAPTGPAAPEDPNGTYLKGVPRADEAPRAVAGDVAALSPAAAAATGETSLGAVRGPHEAPTLRPAIGPGTATGSPRRRRILTAVSVVAGVAVVAAGVAVLGSRGDGARRGTAPAPAAPVSVQRAEPERATGLRVSRRAVYDAAARTLTTTVTWQAGRTALIGPFYENVPVPECGGFWAAGGVAVTPDRTPGITAACGFKVDAGTVAAGGEVTASYTVPFAPEGDAAAAAERFLADAAAATAASLEQLARSAAYPVQRLAAVHVEVPTVVYRGSRISVQLMPVWAGVGEPDNVNVLFDTRRTTRAPHLLRQIAGGLAGVELVVRGCGDAVGLENELYPYATEPELDCRISARVGDVPEAESAPFDIGYESDRR